jgi:hypothetical protein
MGGAGRTRMLWGLSPTARLPGRCGRSPNCGQARRAPGPVRAPCSMPTDKRWARDAYDSFLTDDRDIDTISRALAQVRRPDGTTGYSPEEIAAVKRHLMLEEHRNEHPETGRVEVRRFDPDQDIADAWIRLRAGAPSRGPRPCQP